MRCCFSPQGPTPQSSGKAQLVVKRKGCSKSLLGGALKWAAFILNREAARIPTHRLRVTTRTQVTCSVQCVEGSVKPLAECLLPLPDRPNLYKLRSMKDTEKVTPL